MDGLREARERVRALERIVPTRRGVSLLGAYALCWFYMGDVSTTQAYTLTRTLSTEFQPHQSTGNDDAASLRHPYRALAGIGRRSNNSNNNNASSSTASSTAAAAASTSQQPPSTQQQQRAPAATVAAVLSSASSVASAASAGSAASSSSAAAAAGEGKQGAEVSLRRDERRAVNQWLNAYVRKHLLACSFNPTHHLLSHPF